ncbi:hypothetical protein [Thiomonas sp. FB-Cd]|uniref:hypothetical protein n=1 Tax=Thiomonas sp. FB-Cd TaxID=1158292 RepID=UPI0018CC076D|nr:hypothetical protein [Thiomonas sp. FB-Cd]
MAATLGGAAAAALAAALLVAPATASAKTPMVGPGPYVPGLGAMMLGPIQGRHAKLWFAGNAGNWELAAYELDELQESLEGAGKFHKGFKGKPVGPMIKSMTEEPFKLVDKAIAAKNKADFVAAYDKVSEACTSCHAAAGFPYIVIQRPSDPWFSDMKFSK